MELRHLVLLRELADRGSVAATAAALHITPSAVSQQLRTAERELSAPLVEPHGRGVRLTEAGRLLADGAVDVSSAMAAVERRWAEFRGGVAGTVTIATLPSAGTVLMPGLLARLAGSQVAVRIHDHDVSEAGYAELARDHDLVIGHRMVSRPMPSWRGLSRLELLHEPIDVALPAGDPRAGSLGLDAAELGGARWVGVPQGFPFDDLRLAIEDRAGRALEVVQRVRDNQLVAALVAAGHGIGLLPRLSTRGGEGLALVPLLGVPSGRRIAALARPEVAERGVVRHVLRQLTEIAASLQDD